MLARATHANFHPTNAMQLLELPDIIQQTAMQHCAGNHQMVAMLPAPAPQHNSAAH
jgi:hypothetical protein